MGKRKRTEKWKEKKIFKIEKEEKMENEENIRRKKKKRRKEERKLKKKLEEKWYFPTSEKDVTSPKKKQLPRLVHPFPI